MLVILTYIAMLLSTVVIPLLLLMFWGFDQFTTVIYTNIIAFIIGIFIMLNLLKNNLREERKAHPLTIGRIIGWSKIGRESCRERVQDKVDTATDTST